MVVQLDWLDIISYDLGDSISCQSLAAGVS